MSFGKFQKKEIIDLISCSWSPYWGSGDGTPGGPNLSVQFNSASLFSGSANFTFDPSGSVVNISGSLIVSSSTGAPAQFVIPESNYVYFWDKILGSTNNIRLLTKTFSQGRIEGLNYGTATNSAGGFVIGGSSSDLVLGTNTSGWNIHLRPESYTLGGGKVLLSGSLYVSRSVFFQGLTTSSTVTNVLTFNTTTGQVFYTASSALGSGGGSAISVYDGNNNSVVTSNLNTLYITGSAVSMSSGGTGIVSISLNDSNNIFGTDQYLARFSGSNAVETGSLFNYRYLKTLLAGNQISSFDTDVSGSALFGSGSKVYRNTFNSVKAANVHTFGRFNTSIGSDAGVAMNFATSNVGSYDLVQNLLSSTAPRVHFSCYDKGSKTLYAPFSGDIEYLASLNRLNYAFIANLDISGSVQDIIRVVGVYYNPGLGTLYNITNTDFVDATGGGKYNGIGLSYSQEEIIYGTAFNDISRGNIVCFFIEGGPDGFFPVNSNHAQNIGTSAHGFGTHAEGYYSQTRGEYTHAQNISTIAAGSGSSASGYKSAAAGRYNNANNIFTSAGSTYLVDKKTIKKSNRNVNNFYYDYVADTVDISAIAGHDCHMTYIDDNELGSIFNSNGFNTKDTALKCIVQIPDLDYIGIVELFAKEFTPGSTVYKVITLLDILPDTISATSPSVDIFITPINTGTFFEIKNDTFGGGPGQGAFAMGVRTISTGVGSFVGGIDSYVYGSSSFGYGRDLTINSYKSGFLFGNSSTLATDHTFAIKFNGTNNLIVTGGFVGINTATAPVQNFNGLRVVDNLSVSRDASIGEDLFVTGSTFLGNDLSDITNITGSLFVSNSFSLIGLGRVTGSFVISSSLNVLGTSRITGSNIVSGSWNLIGTGYITGSLIISTSLTTIGTNTTTGSVFITGSSTLVGNSAITGSILMTGSAAISYVNHIDFVTSSTHPHLIGRVHWDNDYGTLNIDLNSTTGNEIMTKVGQDQFYYIKNQTGVTLTKGKVIRAAGTLGASGRILGDYMIADGTIPYFYTIGIAAESIGNGQDGYVYEFGLLRGIQTDGANYGETWTDGTILYVSPTNSGGLTSVEPTAPNLKIQIAIVIDADASNGSIFIRPDLRSNINDLHDVKITAPSSSGDLLVYSSSVWINSKQLTGSYGLTGSLTFLNGGITGSLYGTSSWAHSASVAITSSFSLLSSNVLGGTQYYVPVWTNTTTLSSSAATDNGSLFLINRNTAVTGTFEINVPTATSQVQPAMGINSNGVLFIGKFSSEPAAVEGGLYYDGTNFYLGYQ